MSQTPNDLVIIACRCFLQRKETLLDSRRALIPAPLCISGGCNGSGAKYATEWGRALAETCANDADALTEPERAPVLLTAEQREAAREAARAAEAAELPPLPTPPMVRALVLVLICLAAAACCMLMMLLLL